MESGVLSSDYPCKKDAPKDKDPPEGRVTQSIWAMFIEDYTIVIVINFQLYNADVTTVLKQAKRSFIDPHFLGVIIDQHFWVSL